MTYVEFQPGPERGPVPPKALRKAEEPLGTPLDHNHTQAVVQKERTKYTAIQRQFLNRGFKPFDFQEGGALYGKSNNALIDMLENLKAANGGE